MKPTIKLHRVTHGNRNVILVKFPYSKAIYSAILNAGIGFWDKYHRGMIISDSDESIANLNAIVKGIAIVDGTSLFATTEMKKKLKAPPLPPLKQEVKEQIQTFRAYLEQKRYSQHTIKSYSDCLDIFFRYFDLSNISSVTNEDLMNFNKNYILKYNFSLSYQRQVITSRKLFYKLFSNSNLEIDAIERPRKEKTLPIVLSLKEVENLINVIVNLKHRTMIMMIYACGLRRSELLNIRIADIDSERMLVYIKQGKGKKDRLVPLSEKMLLSLRQYAKAYKPNDLLFTGKNGKQRGATNCIPSQRQRLWRFGELGQCRRIHPIAQRKNEIQEIIKEILTH